MLLRHLMSYIIMSSLALFIYLPAEAMLSPAPDTVPAMSLPEINLMPFTSLWDNLPTPVHSTQPEPFKFYGQDYSFMLYSTRLIGHKSGKLTVIDIHDYATVFLDGRYIGALDRRLGINTIELLRAESQNPLLEIFVEGMGRKNFACAMLARKGITDRVMLNGMTIMNWDVYGFPMDEEFISGLKASENISNKPGTFFKGSFSLEETADTFIDMTNFIKGLVWVNGKKLGRYWEICPRQRLYCPASWLRKGDNEIIIFDLHKTEPGTIRGFETMN